MAGGDTKPAFAESGYEHAGEPTPKVRRTPMEDPFGKSQERPKVFRITSVVLLKDFGTKDLREVLPSNYFCATLWGVQLLPDGSIGVF